MNARPDLDRMMEATRLTREGRLAEAMAMIQRTLGTLRPAGQESDAPSASATADTKSLDMIPPTPGSGGAWTFRAPLENSTPRPDGAGQPDPWRGILDRLGNLGTLRGTPGQAGQGAPPVPVPSGARFEAHTFTAEAGTRAYKLYIPSGYTGQAVPLVVMLHGCTQSPDDFAAGTRMNEVAEEKTFIVAYPAQAQSANPSKCWNWFKPTDQQRDRGEPSLIAGITREIMREVEIDPARVYVAGLSAGGAAAAVMGAVYPDLYAAVGVHSGLACGSATDPRSALAAMRHGGPVAASRKTATHAIPTIVFHGDQDATVSPINADRVVAQAQGNAPLQQTVTRGQSPGGVGYTRLVKADAKGRSALEHWTLHGAGHAWSGGSAAGSYTDPLGPDASREMVRFFLELQEPPRRLDGVLKARDDYEA